MPTLSRQLRSHLRSCVWQCSQLRRGISLGLVASKQIERRLPGKDARKTVSRDAICFHIFFIFYAMSFASLTLGAHGEGMMDDSRLKRVLPVGLVRATR